MGVVNISVRTRLAVNGTLLVFSSFFQWSNRISLYSWLNGPEYDRNAEPSKTSPTNLEVSIMIWQSHNGVCYIVLLLYNTAQHSKCLQQHVLSSLHM